MKGKERFIVTIIAFFLLFSMSIGYAVYSIRTNVGGTAALYGNGDVVISNAVLTNYNNLQSFV